MGSLINKIINDKGTRRKVYAGNGVYLGDIDTDDSGFYVFWPHLDSGGYWSARLLSDILHELHDLNAPIEAELNDYHNR